MKRRFKTVLQIGLIGCLCGTCLLIGCTDAVQQERQEEANVYRIAKSSRTMNQWENTYGVITSDGRMVLPMQNQEVNIISDESTGEAVWIQTVIYTLEDSSIPLEELYVEGLWDKIHLQYMLYDLDGNPTAFLGERGVSQVCDNLVLYTDGQLKNKETGERYFDNIDRIRSVGEYYVMQQYIDGYANIRVTDHNLQVLYETQGELIQVEDTYYLDVWKNEKHGIQCLDGTVIVPCEYDYFSSYYALGVPYILAHKDEIDSVISLKDGTTLYQEEEAHAEYDTYILYLLEDRMLIQTRERKNVSRSAELEWPFYQYYSQFCDYAGDPISKRYLSLNPHPELYRQAKAENEDVDLLCEVVTEDGENQIINQNGEILYRIPENHRVSIVDQDRFILHTDTYDTAALYNWNEDCLSEKPYQYMYAMYIENDAETLVLEKLLCASYTVGNTMLYDVLDMDGTVLLERLKSVTALSENRFWVEKGFSQGLMDREGNWIYQQSIFDSAIDES